MKIITELLNNLSFANVEQDHKLYTVSVPKEKLRETMLLLHKNNKLLFDFLIDIVGIDYGDNIGILYYLSPTKFPSHILILKTLTNNREYPEVDSVHDLWQSAGLYEREVFDFLGIYFINNPDMRRLFLRQDWNGFPLRKDYDTKQSLNPIPIKDENLESLPTIKINLNQKLTSTKFQPFNQEEYIINFGPQHPATHGVLHLRVSLDGENIKKIDPHFGYIHRGIEKMSESYTYKQILHLVDRMDYLSGTIYRHGLCLAIEKSLKLEIPKRVHYIRTIIDELTRIASHLLGWGCMAMDMGSITAFVYGMRDREKIMDIFEETCGGRLMPNYNIIGGVANDIHQGFQPKIKQFIPYMRKMLKEHHLLFSKNPIARGRMKNIGYLSKEDAISLGATGPTGRASGWSNDIRKIEPYAAYRYVNFEEVLRNDGFTFDRYIIRLNEIEESLKIIEQLIDCIPYGDYFIKTKSIIKLPNKEIHQRVEGTRGEFDIYINSKGDKHPYRIKFRSPSLPLVNVLKTIAIKHKIADLMMIGGSLDYVVPCIDR